MRGNGGRNDHNGGLAAEAEVGLSAVGVGEEEGLSTDGGDDIRELYPGAAENLVVEQDSALYYSATSNINLNVINTVILGLPDPLLLFFLIQTSL